MSFVSREFALFFTIVAAVYFVLPYRVRWIWLLAASIYFYGSSVPLFLVQILLATAIAYGFGRLIERAPDNAAKRPVLVMGLCLLAGNLIAFKYTGFLNESLRWVFESTGLTYPVPRLNILLPIGISFYTFLLVGYLIDVFRGTRAERHAGIFSLYVLF